MPEFDPRKYVEANAPKAEAQAFDPKAYVERSKQQAAAPAEPDMVERASRATLNFITEAGRKVDSVTGAPTRAAIGAMQSGENPFRAFGRQFAEDPELAPTGKEIAVKAGFSEDKVIPTPFRAPDYNPDGTWGMKLMKVSPAQVAGTGIDVLADPTTIIPPSKAAGLAFKGATKAAGAVGREGLRGLGMLSRATLGSGFTEKARNKLASAFANIPEHKIKDYMSRPVERMAAAPGVEDTKDTVDMMVRSLELVKDDAAKSVADATRKVDEVYKIRLGDLRHKSVPTNLADEMVGSLANEKRALGTLSEQADDALARTPGAVTKADTLAFLDKIGNSVSIGKKGAVVGDKANAAVTRLYELRQRIDGGFADQISHVELRDILRQVRDDIDFGGTAGEMNTTLNRMRKEFTHGLSDLLKQRSPEYDGIMQRMKALSDNLEVLDNYFGTRERALGSLEGAVSSGSPRAKLINEALERNAALTGNRAVLDKLGEFRQARDLLEQAKTKDLRPLLAPDELKQLQAYQADLLEAEAAYEPARALGKRRTEGLSEGNRKLTIEDERAIQHLEKIFEVPILQNIEDRAALEAFTKDAGRGGRYQVIGGSVGGALGNMIAGPAGIAVGVPIGTTVGTVVEKNAGAITRRLLDATRNIRPDGPPTTEAIGEVLKTLRNRTSIETGLKGAQIYSTQDELGNAAARRTAIRRRMEKEEKGRLAE